MRAVLPGRPQPKLRAVCTGQWAGQRLVVYISGTALVILAGPHQLLQTIYHDDGPELDAVCLDVDSGKIAICAGPAVHVHRPYGRDEGALKWSLQCTFTVDPAYDGTRTLSWGSSEELLVGGRTLELFSTTSPDDADKSLWRQELASPVKYADFSYDAVLIASTGRYDRLVKIWRSLYHGSDDLRFDFSYLAHPSTVTAMHWRKSYHREQTIENILYTLCADGVLRVWAATDPHGLQTLQLWTQIDLQESIKPRLCASVEPSRRRAVFIIDNCDFLLATEKAVQSAPTEAEESHALSHLMEVAHRAPEICVVVDDAGHMSAWGLENAGCKFQKPSNVFNIAHVDGLELFLTSDRDTDDDYVQFLTFFTDKGEDGFTVLVHHFDGRIEWFGGSVDQLFDPSPRRDRLTSKALWTGHISSVEKIYRTPSGKALISRAAGNQTLLWKEGQNGDQRPLIQQSVFTVPDAIVRTCILDEGDFVVLLHRASVSLWDTRSSHAIELAACDYAIEGKPLCLIAIPNISTKTRYAHVATVSSEMRGIAWQVNFPATAGDSSGHGVKPAIVEFCNFELGPTDQLTYVLPVDPAGSSSTISGFIDTFARDVALSYNDTGVLRSWTAKVDVKTSRLEWLQTSNVETGIDHPSLASGTSIRKAAMVDSLKTELTIWDTRGAQLEYENRFEAQDVIRDLDWTSTPDNQSILAVGFPHRVILLAQMRYDYLDEGPAWASIREIRIRDLTPHPIGDSSWLSSGNLVIGAGNQLFVCAKTVDVGEDILKDLRLSSHQPLSHDLFNIVTRLNGPLPIFHPQFLAQCVLRGKVLLVQRILLALHQKLKFFTPGDELDSFLDLPSDVFYDELEEHTNPAKKEMRSYADLVEDDESDSLTETVAASLNEMVAHIAIPQLSGQEQLHLADIIECAAVVVKHRRSMDGNAARFLLFFRQHMLRKGRTGQSQVPISWREISWAQHSISQDILVDLVSRQFQGRILWEHARESGMFMWLSDVSAVRTQFEVIARNEYTKTDEKNPIDCSLFYFALRKKNILLGLWRMAAWNREQRSTQKLLANNFGEARWKTAALKNAYALLGRHRFEYAAAFFLLADHLRDAVGVCINPNQLNDLQLGIAIARVYEGDESPVLRDVLRDEALPQAAQTGNRWLASWAFWMLNRRDMATRSLISPVHTLLPNAAASPDLHSKLFRVTDPALVVLFKQLRETSLQALRASGEEISPKQEWDFVVRTAELYDRMGCDLLALDLVRNWDFLRPPPPAPKTVAHEETGTIGRRSSVKSIVSPTFDPRKMLRRRSSLVVADPIRHSYAPDAITAAANGDDHGEHAIGEEGEAPKAVVSLPLRAGPSAKPKPAPTTFEEPSANSLLDSFGF